MAYRFTVIGGDARQEEIIYMLLKEGHKVNVLGFSHLKDPRANIFYELNKEALDCHVLILPIPYKDKEGKINMKGLNMGISLWDIVKYLGSCKPIVILGKADEDFLGIVRAEGLDFCDLTVDESFSILNAIPTAEGAIQRAMEMTDTTIHGSKVLILGYGRIGKSLSRMLKGIGALVTVVARKMKDLAWIEENGYEALPLWELDKGLHHHDIIFNTIPKLILDGKRIALVKKGAVIIDLASRPGGVDFAEARNLGIKATLEPGLPGIVAPKTAAEIIHRIMMNYIEEKM